MFAFLPSSASPIAERRTRWLQGCAKDLVRLQQMRSPLTQQRRGVRLRGIWLFGRHPSHSSCHQHVSENTLVLLNLRQVENTLNVNFLKSLFIKHLEGLISVLERNSNTERFLWKICSSSLNFLSDITLVQV